MFYFIENEDLDLRALALDCFFSKNSNSYDTSSKYYLLKNGYHLRNFQFKLTICIYAIKLMVVRCAVDSAVTLYQSPEWKRASRLSFKFNRFYYEPTSHLFLHCRIGACSNRGQREAEGFPQVLAKLSAIQQSIDLYQLSISVPLVNPLQCWTTKRNHRGIGLSISKICQNGTNPSGRWPNDCKSRR